MSFSEIEARLRRVGLRMDDAEHEVVRIRDARGKIRQDLGVIGSGFGDRPCTTTLSGFISGCINALPGGTLRFLGHTTGIDYGTFTADGSGNYVADMEIIDLDSALDVYTGPAPRFNDVTPASTGLPFSRCATNVGENFTTTPATGYFCVFNGFNGACNWPVAKTLNCTDSGNVGTFTVTSTGGDWTGSHGGIAYVLHWTGFLFTVKLTPPGTTVNEASHVCPAPATSTKFSATFNNVITAGRTVTFQEP